MFYNEVQLLLYFTVWGSYLYLSGQRSAVVLFNPLFDFVIFLKTYYGFHIFIGAADYATFIREQHVAFIDILNAFSSCKPPFERLLGGSMK
jgi:hypothetical protein